MKRLAKKILLIGWDAADWKIINKLIDDGLMPATEKLVNKGVMGNLTTLDPPFSPMLWTSIATGMRPDKHGILGFIEPNPRKQGVRPVSSLSRKVKAIWNILNQQNIKSHVVGWWPSHPAEPINGIMISNLYQQADEAPDRWKIMQGTVHPPELSRLFEHLRIHPYELTSEHILPFVPKAAEIDQTKDPRLSIIYRNLAECASIQSVATWIMENQKWDFMSVYFDTIDHFSHAFINYHPPKLDGISDKEFKLYKDVITGAYRFHDMMLARMLQLAGKDTTVMIVSDHGFHSDHLRPTFIPDELAGPSYQHRQHGIFCMAGPNIKKDEIIYGANLLDITPTLLTLFGLPTGKDMDGTPLVIVNI
ncbi:MAG: hypothetical protein HN704_00165 [Bacteroidetes bacterium]|nr:hypothetical protein [Bacteroidota bacterium]MBT6684752.1 hypothetical protein [Bacteroidota bacterium]MBT7144734.1 hypothetical protein [Bacteroidota bacterium]MBT7489998.1 hypothetical protein [Bacteroidota bacterium]